MRLSACWKACAPRAVASIAGPGRLVAAGGIHCRPLEGDCLPSPAPPPASPSLLSPPSPLPHCILLLCNCCAPAGMHARHPACSIRSWSTLPCSLSCCVLACLPNLPGLAVQVGVALPGTVALPRTVAPHSSPAHLSHHHRPGCDRLRGSAAGETRRQPGCEAWRLPGALAAWRPDRARRAARPPADRHAARRRASTCAHGCCRTQAPRCPQLAVHMPSHKPARRAGALLANNAASVAVWCLQVTWSCLSRR